MVKPYPEYNFPQEKRITLDCPFPKIGYDDELLPRGTSRDTLQTRIRYHPPTSKRTLDETLKRNLEESLTRTLTINNKTENRRIGWIITAVIASSIALGSIGYNWIIPYFTKKQPEILQKEPEIIYGIH